MQHGTQFYLLSLGRRALGEAKVPSVGYLIFAILALGLIALWSFWKREQNDGSYIARAFVIATTFVVLLSPHYVWYFAWLVAFTCLLPRFPFFYLTTACYVLYKLWLPAGRDQLLFLDTIIYLPFAMLGLIALFQRARRDRARGGLRHLLEREPV